MRLSAELTFRTGGSHGFAAEPVERMIRLFDVLETFSDHEVIGSRMALAGGRR